MEDKKLVKRAMKGNVKAYGELIALYQEQLYRIAFLRMRDEQLALDMIQDTVVRGYERIKTLKKEACFKTWLIRILLNQISDFYRKNGKETAIDHMEETQASDERIFSERIEESIDLKDAIERLPERQRMIIILKYFQDMKISEIAGILDIPEGSVKAYLFRGKDNLKKILGEDYLYE